MYKIFVSGMAYDGGKSGISDYMRQVIKVLMQNHKIDLIMLEEDIDSFPLSHPNLTIIPVSNRLKKPIINMLWHLFIVPFVYNLKQYDFVFLPAANRRIICRSPIPVVATFHDLSQFNIAAKYDRFRMFYIKKIVPFYVKKFDIINAISENTRNDMIMYYKMDGKNIKVNHNGFDNEQYAPLSGAIDLPLDLKKEFLLYIARIEHPGKNHLRLIKAYELLPEETKERFDLVLAGKCWSGGEVVEEYAKRSSDCNRIKFLGFVSSEDLVLLYKCASLYVFPSLYEGFGIPLLEAMASGVPVVCSNTSSLPEIGGEAVITFDPLDIDNMVDIIRRVLVDSELQQTLIDRGLHRVKGFSWKNHGANIISYYEELN